MKYLVLFLIPTILHAEQSFPEGRNVFSKKIQKCSDYPKTGFYRDGYCHTGPQDQGTHVACAKVTKEFLEFTKSKGNDLMTPNPAWSFPGLKPGDKWCLCALRWLEAKKAGVEPKLDLRATNIKMLEFSSLRELKKVD
jgi:hypothetical protein